MNKDKIIKELLSAGLTPEDIYSLAQSHNAETRARQKARKDVLNAIFNYIKYLIPDVEITEEDKKNMNEYLKDFEEKLEAFVKVAEDEQEKKDASEDAIRRFLIKLGC